MIEERMSYIVDGVTFYDKQEAEKYVDNKSWYFSSVYKNGTINTDPVYFGNILEFLDKYKYEVMKYYSKFGKEI